MARSDDEVVDELRAIHNEQFAGKERQRFLISWSDIRSLYGFMSLHESRFARLVEAAAEQGLYIFDLGELDSGRMIAVLKSSTVNRWRRVPRGVIRDHLPPATIRSEDDDEDDDD